MGDQYEARWTAALRLVEYYGEMLGLKIPNKQDPDWHEMKDEVHRELVRRNWISVERGMPKRKDAGYFRDVLVLPRDHDPVYVVPYIVPFHLVRKRTHSHWMPLLSPLGK